MPLDTLQYRYTSPIGTIIVRGSNKGLSHVLVQPEEQPKPSIGIVRMEVAEVEKDDMHHCMHECCTMLDEYFNGDLQAFHSLRLAYSGTEFELRVWEALLNVPFGTTFTYKQIAEHIGQPKAARAVGNALNKNPIHIIIPCHRVIPSSGKYGNYAAGPEKKEWLLNHEQER